MECLPVLTTDLEIISALTPPDWQDAALSFGAYLTMDNSIAVKIMQDDRLAGVGAAICFSETGWLAHIIVDSNYRGKGLGFQLVDHLLKVMKTRGVERVGLLATSMGEPVYLRAGFRVICLYQFYTYPEGELRFERSPFVHEYGESDLSEILELDLCFSGEKREELLVANVEGALVYRDQSLLLGYYLPAWGEGLIVALNGKAGISLMEEKAQQGKRFGVPDQNKVAIEWLLNQGFTPKEMYISRMYYGEDLEWNGQFCYSRIGGSLG